MKSLLTYIFLFLFKGKKIAEYYAETDIIFVKTKDELGDTVYQKGNIFIHGDKVELINVSFSVLDIAVHISGCCYIKDTDIKGNTNITESSIINSSFYNASIKYSRLSDVQLWSKKPDYTFTIVGDRFFSFSNVGISRRKVYFDGNLILAGCFVGTIEELEEKVAERYTAATIKYCRDTYREPIIWYSDIIPIMKRIRSEIMNNKDNPSSECPKRFVFIP